MSEDPSELQGFLDETVAPLVAYDDQYETELVRTLETFLEADGNVAGTAEKLFTHRHTMRYRLERVRELTGLDVGSTDGRERLGLGPQGDARAGHRARRAAPPSERGAEAGRVPPRGEGSLSGPRPVSFAWSLGSRLIGKTAAFWILEPGSSPGSPVSTPSGEPVRTCVVPRRPSYTEAELREANRGFELVGRGTQEPGAVSAGGSRDTLREVTLRYGESRPTISTPTQSTHSSTRAQPRALCEEILVENSSLPTAAT